MLLKIGAVLVLAWLVVLGVGNDVGSIKHAPLFVGLMLLMLGLLKARDAAITAARESNDPTRSAKR